MINLVNNCVLVVGCNHNAVDYGNLVDPVVNRTHIFAFLPSRFFFLEQRRRTACHAFNFLPVDL